MKLSACVYRDEEDEIKKIIEAMSLFALPPFKLKIGWRVKRKGKNDLYQFSTGAYL